MNVDLTIQKLNAAANLIVESALQAMAEKNGLTVEQVREYIANGHVGAMRQFKQFATLAVDQAVKMHDAGEISLTA